MAYHYTDSGLDNVYLDNGYEPYKAAYGEGVSIQDIDGLHVVIGKGIVERPSIINGAELRFLRLEMGLTQKAIGGIMGQKEQVIQRWEKSRNKDINGSADRLLRALYLEYTGGKGDVRRMVDRLALLNHVERSDIYLCDTESGWQPQGCVEVA